MASPAALRQALELSASNFHPRNADQWVEDMVTAWIRHPAIAGASDGELERAVIEHMGSGQFAPKLADIVGRLRGGAHRPGPDSTGPVCLDCGGTGWREGAVLRTDGEVEGPFALACGCTQRKGIPWSDWAQRQGARRDVARYWVTGRMLPQIPDEGRLVASQIQARKERAQGGKVLNFAKVPRDEFAGVRARQEKELKREGWR